MNQIDCKQAQRVWSRVMAAQTGGASEAAAPTAPQTQTQTLLTAQEVLSCMQAELSDAATYRALSARMKGAGRRCMQQLSREECRHAKKLGAIYFLLTGKKACPAQAKAPCITCNAETLRKQYQAELAARDGYEQLAARAGSRSCTLRTLALDECRHAQQIYSLLQTCL